LLATCPTPQAEGPSRPLTRLLIQYIRSYPPHMEAVFSIRIPSTHHDVVAKTHATWFLHSDTVKISDGFGIILSACFLFSVIALFGILTINMHSNDNLRGSSNINRTLFRTYILARNKVTLLIQREYLYHYNITAYVSAFFQ